MKRIRLNGGHAEISFNGMNFKPDETGAFEVPDDAAEQLLATQGGMYDPGVEQLEQSIQAADAAVGAAEYTLKLKREEAAQARKNLEAYNTAAAARAAEARKTDNVAQSQKPGQQNGNQQRK